MSGDRSIQRLIVYSTDVSLEIKSKLSPAVFVKPDLTTEERAMESLLLKERRILIEKGVSRQH